MSDSKKAPKPFIKKGGGMTAAGGGNVKRFKVQIVDFGDGNTNNN